MKHVQLNEDLEKLGEDEIINGVERKGQIFAQSAIESIQLPSALKIIEAGTFMFCDNLRSVIIPNGVECIG